MDGGKKLNFKSDQGLNQSLGEALGPQFPLMGIITFIELICE